MVALLLAGQIVSGPLSAPPSPPSPLIGCVSAGSSENNEGAGRASAAPFLEKVTVHLTRTFAGGDRVSFGVPVPPGVNLTSVNATRVLRSGVPVAASVREILGTHDRCGARSGIRVLQIQFDASL